MNIPTKLITTTIDEFKAEGYECVNVSADSNAIHVSTGETTQLINLTFKKTETDNA